MSHRPTHFKVASDDGILRVYFMISAAASLSMIIDLCSFNSLRVRQLLLFLGILRAHHPRKTNLFRGYESSEAPRASLLSLGYDLIQFRQFGGLEQSKTQINGSLNLALWCIARNSCLPLGLAHAPEEHLKEQKSTREEHS
jgi:hypothetical protein